MSKKWALAEGIEKLLSENSEGESEIDDLSTYERRLTLDVSFAVVEVDAVDGMKIDKTSGINVILSGDNPLEDDDSWLFSRTILPVDGETLPELVKRIATGLGIKPDGRIWEDGA